MLLEGPIPCHVYLSLPEDATDAMIVTFQVESTKDNKNKIPAVYYDTISHGSNSSLEDYKHKAIAVTNIYKSLEIQRGIYWAYLHELHPDTGSHLK